MWLRSETTLSIKVAPMPRLGQDLDLLGEFFGILVECPIEAGNPKGCQLHHIRTVDLHQRYSWAIGLDLAEAHRLRKECRKCMAKKMQSLGLGMPPS